MYSFILEFKQVLLPPIMKYPGCDVFQHASSFTYSVKISNKLATSPIHHVICLLIIIPCQSSSLASPFIQPRSRLYSLRAALVLLEICQPCRLQAVRKTLVLQPNLQQPSTPKELLMICFVLFCFFLELGDEEAEAKISETTICEVLNVRQVCPGL